MIGKTRENYTPNFDSFTNSIIYRDDHELILKTIDSVFKNKPETYEVEYRVNHPAKEFIWLSHLKDQGKLAPEMISLMKRNNCGNKMYFNIKKR